MPALKVFPEERGRFALLAGLLFLSAMVIESNEVVATSGFISSVGVSRIVLVWALDMTIIILTSGVYSLFVDRMPRARLAVFVFFGFSVGYLGLSGLFTTQAQGIAYVLLLVVNDQQWLLFPLLIWALANDIFNIASAKRLFPLLGLALLGGGIVGNLLAAAVARASGSGSALLLLNSAIVASGGCLLLLALRRISVPSRHMREGERVLDTLREGLAFVREVPAFRYLTLSMILLGIGLNAVEFEFLSAVSRAFTSGGDVQAFYGVYKGAVAVGLLLAQSVLTGWLLRKTGFRNIFLSLPGVMVAALLLALLSPVLLGITLANYLVRVTRLGFDEPAIKAFQGLVPDERRGRVSAFLDGYLVPLGSIIGCISLFTLSTLADANFLTAQVARMLGLSIALIAASGALYSAWQIRRTYDSSMLNWRLKRRRRDKAADSLQPEPERRFSAAALLDSLTEDAPGPSTAPVPRRPRRDVLGMLGTNIEPNNDSSPKPPASSD